MVNSFHIQSEYQNGRGSRIILFGNIQVRSKKKDLQNLMPEKQNVKIADNFIKLSDSYYLNIDIFDLNGVTTFLSLARFLNFYKMISQG